MAVAAADPVVAEEDGGVVARDVADMAAGGVVRDDSEFETKCEAAAIAAALLLFVWRNESLPPES